MNDWAVRPLDETYAAIGVTLGGERDILGLWVGTGGEGTKFWMSVLKARGHFPSEQAALKCLYLVTRSLDPTGVGRTRWTMRGNLA